MTTQPASPLRYPGGKACLARLLEDVIDLNDLRGGSYFEPYAGGAGAGLELLHVDAVSDIWINDADPRIGAFWRAVLHETDRFAEEIMKVPLTIEEWRQQAERCTRPDPSNSFITGFAAFYMNRCNRSGVLSGAGPIGGYAQSGKWRLDVRFNREALARRILSVGSLRARIHTSCLDAIKFLQTKLPRGNARQQVLVFLDPPYVNKGQRLYLNSYDASDHATLSRYLGRQQSLPWVMSYDDTDLIRQLYRTHRIAHLPIRYSLQDKRQARELFIASERVVLPKSRLVIPTSRE
jgi:DNA adenine methylase